MLPSPPLSCVDSNLADDSLNQRERQTAKKAPCMARQSKKNNTKAKTKSKRGSGDGDDDLHFGWSDARPYVLGFLAIIALPAIIIAWIIGMPKLKAYAAEATVAANHNLPIQITFTHEPCIIDGVDQTVLEQAYALVQSNPIDHTVLTTLRQAMINSAWFDSNALRVSRDLDTDPESGETFDHITIDGPIRQPYAQIRAGEVDYLVDITGTRLPLSVQAGQVKILITITGTGTPPPKPGTIWPGSNVADGLALVRLLYTTANPDDDPRPWLDQVKTIDVSNADGARRDLPRIVIISDRDNRIIWGRPIGQEFGVEIPPHEKMRLLDLEYAERRRIDHAQGELRINLPVKTVQPPPPPPPNG
ncbi:MAG: hypothetical protein D8M59_15475 [Planctomycetes bacterium]|nr:hypothetical protein [Planctomycetota bacterium]